MDVNVDHLNILRLQRICIRLIIPHSNVLMTRITSDNFCRKGFSLEKILLTFGEIRLHFFPFFGKNAKLEEAKTIDTQCSEVGVHSARPKNENFGILLGCHLITKVINILSNGFPKENFFLSPSLVIKFYCFRQSKTHIVDYTLVSRKCSRRRLKEHWK